MNPEIFGFIAVFLSLYASITINDSKLRLLSIIGGLFWISHFFLLGKMTEVFVLVLIVIRLTNAHLFLNHPKIIRHLVANAYNILFIVIMILTWRGWQSMVSTTACVIATYSFFFASGIELRRQLIIPDFLWMITGMVTGSLSMTIQSLLTIILKVVAIYRLKPKPKYNTN